MRVRCGCQPPSRMSRAPKACAPSVRTGISQPRCSDRQCADPEVKCRTRRTANFMSGPALRCSVHAWLSSFPRMSRPALHLTFARSSIGAHSGRIAQFRRYWMRLRMRMRVRAQNSAFAIAASVIVSVHAQAALSEACHKRRASHSQAGPGSIGGREVRTPRRGSRGVRARCRSPQAITRRQSA